MRLALKDWEGLQEVGTAGFAFPITHEEDQYPGCLLQYPLVLLAPWGRDEEET